MLLKFTYASRFKNPPRHLDMDNVPLNDAFATLKSSLQSNELELRKSLGRAYEVEKDPKGTLPQPKSNGCAGESQSNGLQPNKEPLGSATNALRAKRRPLGDITNAPRVAALKDAKGAVASQGGAGNPEEPADLPSILSSPLIIANGKPVLTPNRASVLSKHMGKPKNQAVSKERPKNQAVSKGRPKNQRATKEKAKKAAIVKARKPPAEPRASKKLTQQETPRVVQEVHMVQAKRPVLRQNPHLAIIIQPEDICGSGIIWVRRKK